MTTDQTHPINLSPPPVITVRWKDTRKAPSMFLEYTQHDTALGEEIQENVWLNLAEDRESNKKYHPEAEETGMIYKKIG